MFVQRILLFICSIAFLYGCSSLEDNNYGGQFHALDNNDKSLNKEVIKLYITNAESELLILQKQSTAQCISGQLAIAQSYIDRAHNENLAGMNKDVFITLVAFDRQIRKIRCVNQYINEQLGCGITNQNIVLRNWYAESDFNQCNTLSKITKNTFITSVDTRKNNNILITETLHDFDQEKIKPIYFQSLNKLVSVTKNHPYSRLVITGHTDSIGSKQYNIKLSEKRANNVKRFFTDNGINPTRIAIRYEGEGSIREVENSNVSRMFNRYTSIILFLDTRGQNNI